MAKIPEGVCLTCNGSGLVAMTCPRCKGRGCGNCHNTGEIPRCQTCPTCNGSGQRS